ncbi:MerR family transcriptional regulator [Planococcus sp. APC 4015]|nr:MerR family transcriptional regulator [Planococcus sp. APC 4015]
MTEWSIQQVARLAGTTSRALRHYGAVGLLAASRVGANGYRYYDDAALVRLQRILLLRDLGLGLPQIAEVLARDDAEVPALRGHLAWLRQEQQRLARQIASVESTITALRGGEGLMAENMFDGFDHTHYKHEVEQRWGASAYATSDTWWRGMGDEGRAQWRQRSDELARDWVALAQSGDVADGEAAQAIARRHVDWLTAIPGSPASAESGDAADYIIGLGEMYVADPRFAANYGGAAGAEFVRDALRAYAQANL